MLLTTIALVSLAAMTAMLDEPLPQAVSLTLSPKGASDKAGYFMPLGVEVSEKRPEHITKAPDDLKAPKYAVLKFGSFSILGNDGTPMPRAEGERLVDGPAFAVILDEPEGAPSRVFVDSNGDGDLTNDPAPEWKTREEKNPDGSDIVTYTGSAEVHLGTVAGGAPRVVNMGLYRFDKKDQRRAAVVGMLVVHRDYLATGTMKIGEQTLNVMLADDRASGDFRGVAPPAPPAAPDKPEGEAKAPEGEVDIGKPEDTFQSGVMLLVDVNGNEKIDYKGEAFDVRKPFNIGGTTYELSDVAADGTGFKLVKSSKTVDEIKPPPDHAVGKKITPFEAKLLDGKPVKFPGDYKGKIVLIDFWATWCGPCIHEVPNVVAAYDKLHGKGFEVLGISLDQEGALEKLQQMTGEKKMVWPQVYEGKGWQSKLVDLYSVTGIPACWLVDGDTGLIVADESRLRGPGLVDTVEEALAKKNGGKN